MLRANLAYAALERQEKDARQREAVVGTLSYAAGMRRVVREIHARLAAEQRRGAEGGEDVQQYRFVA